MQAVAETDLGQRLRRQVACLADGTAREERRDHRVLERRHLAEQIVELEDEADLMTSVADEPRFAPAEDVLALEEHPASGGTIEGTQHMEERRLANTGGAHKRDDLAGADHADRHADAEEHDRDGATGRADGLEDADLLALFGDQQHQVANDGEGGHQHDDGDDDEQRELLELKRGEEVAIEVHPVADPEREPELPRDHRPYSLRREGVDKLDLDAGHAGGQAREFPGGG